MNLYPHCFQTTKLKCYILVTLAQARVAGCKRCRQYVARAYLAKEWARNFYFRILGFEFGIKIVKVVVEIPLLDLDAFVLLLISFPWHHSRVVISWEKFNHFFCDLPANSCDPILLSLGLILEGSFWKASFFFELSEKTIPLQDFRTSQDSWCGFPLCFVFRGGLPDLLHQGVRKHKFPFDDLWHGSWAKSCFSQFSPWPASRSVCTWLAFLFTFWWPRSLNSLL